MIYVYHGADTYSIKEALVELRSGVGSPDLQDVNTTELTASEVTLPLLMNACSTVPFLADRRLIIVDGLLSSMERRQPARRGRRTTERTGPQDDAGPPNQWRSLGESLTHLPPTTDLVFTEGPLRRDNPLLRDLAPIAQVRDFPSPTGADLERWITQRVSQHGAAIAPDATQLLADVVGPDLWAQNSEIEKLTLYRYGQQIRSEDVGAVVSSAKEASVFAAVDAVLERRSGQALQLITRLLDGGGTVSYVLAMLARQVRLVLLAQELLRDRVPQGEMGARLGIASAYPLRKTLDQARRSRPEAMRHLHGMLLEADIAIKTGEMEEQLALDVLVVRFCHGQQAAAGSARGR